MLNTLVKENWIEIKDSDPRAVAIFRRHYTARENVDYVKYGFSGKGESMILMTLSCDALFCWRLVKGIGVCCSVFRNESNILSSDLIREAVEMALNRWPGAMIYTFVNPRKVHGDGKCFKAAGFYKLPKRTKKQRLIELRFAQ